MRQLGAERRAREPHRRAALGRGVEAPRADEVKGASCLVTRVRLVVASSASDFPAEAVRRSTTREGKDHYPAET